MTTWVKINPVYIDRVKLFEVYRKFYQLLIPDYNNMERVELIFKTIKNLSSNIPATANLIGYHVDPMKQSLYFMCHDKSFEMQNQGALLPSEPVRLSVDPEFAFKKITDEVKIK